MMGKPLAQGGLQCHMIFAEIPV
jgi:hypothetical protein